MFEIHAHDGFNTVVLYRGEDEAAARDIFDRAAKKHTKYNNVSLLKLIDYWERE